MSNAMNQKIKNHGDTPTDDEDRDSALRRIVGDDHRPTNPRNLFDRANEYVPTKVRGGFIDR